MKGFSAVICWITGRFDNVRGIWLFGSQINGRARRNSDYDLIVETDAPSPTMAERVAMRRESKDLFGVDVDVVVVRDCAAFVKAMRISVIEQVYVE